MGCLVGAGALGRGGLSGGKYLRKAYAKRRRRGKGLISGLHVPHAGSCCTANWRSQAAAPFGVISWCSSCLLPCYEFCLLCVPCHGAHGAAPACCLVISAASCVCPVLGQLLLLPWSTKIVEKNCFMLHSSEHAVIPPCLSACGHGAKSSGYEAACPKASQQGQLGAMHG